MSDLTTNTIRSNLTHMGKLGKYVVTLVTGETQKAINEGLQYVEGTTLSVRHTYYSVPNPSPIAWLYVGEICVAELPIGATLVQAVDKFIDAPLS